jgi:hypothetical protein
MADSKTFFDTMTFSYVDVIRVQGEIEVETYLKATESLITIFDHLSPTAFIPIKADMNGNVLKIRQKYLKDTDKYSTLEKIVRSESETKDKVATQGLLWLNRGLKFIYQALNRSQEDKEEELCDSFSASYGEVLKPYHSFLVSPIFKLAMRACPYRADFYDKLAPSKEVLDEEFPKWLGSLGDCVKSVDDLFAEKDYGKGL